MSQFARVISINQWNFIPQVAENCDAYSIISINILEQEKKTVHENVLVSDVQALSL